MNRSIWSYVRLNHREECGLSALITAAAFVSLTIAAIVAVVALIQNVMFWNVMAHVGFAVAGGLIGMWLGYLIVWVPSIWAFLKALPGEAVWLTKEIWSGIRAIPADWRKWRAGAPQRKATREREAAEAEERALRRALYKAEHPVPLSQKLRNGARTVLKVAGGAFGIVGIIIVIWILLYGLCWLSWNTMGKPILALDNKNTAAATMILLGMLYLVALLITGFASAVFWHSIDEPTWSSPDFDGKVGICFLLSPLPLYGWAMGLWLLDTLMAGYTGFTLGSMVMAAFLGIKYECSKNLFERTRERWHNA